jgi:hypothetical protein
MSAAHRKQPRPKAVVGQKWTRGLGQATPKISRAEVAGLNDWLAYPKAFTCFHVSTPISVSASKASCLIC